MYQTEWHGIEFTKIRSLSSSVLAGAEFYDEFYKLLFEKYSGYTALDFDWRTRKDETADWITTQCRGITKVLSIGCGIGYVEKRLWSQKKDGLELHVLDYAPDSLKWLKEVLPHDHVHDTNTARSRIMNPRSEEERFDVIYLCAVDYAIPDKDLIAFLSDLRSCLRKDGSILLISASFLNESMAARVVRSLKDAGEWFLERIGVRSRGQFWGWMRTAGEYQAILRKAGLSRVTDGFIETGHQRTYWIKGTGELSS